MGIFVGVTKISNIFWGCLKCLMFFFFFFFFFVCLFCFVFCFFLGGGGV